MILSRRSLFGIGAAFVAAPAIVRVSSLMPVSVLPAATPGDDLAKALAESIASYTETYVRPRIIQLSAEMDLAIYEATYGAK